MLHTYVALLRGINVGGNNLIKMVDLKAEFEHLGFHAVKTYIQSGNVIFQSDLNSPAELKPIIEERLKQRFNYKAIVLVRSQAQMEDTVAHFPAIFADSSWKHNVIFLGSELDFPEIITRFELKPGIEQISYYPGVIYWSAQLATITSSNMLKLSARREYQQMTVRNMNTTRKILSLMA